MAVQVEMLSVVMRADRLALAEAAGAVFDWRSCNPTYCTDGDLARVGFMNPLDVRAFVEGLAAHGLVYLDEGRARDLVVIEMGVPVVPCDWVEVVSLPASDTDPVPVEAARLRGGPPRPVSLPEAWHRRRAHRRAQQT